MDSVDNPVPAVSPAEAPSPAPVPLPAPQPAVAPEDEPNFAQMLAQYEGQNEKAGPAVGERRTGKIVSIKVDVALVDIGAKGEGVLPQDQWHLEEGREALKPGDSVEVIVEGRDAEGSFKLSLYTPDRPRNVEDARIAYENGIILRGKVTGAIKGGLAVDVGMRGFIPQSKSGVRDPNELHKLVGQEIRCRIARAPEKNNLVLDRRSLLEEEQKVAARQTLDRLHEGDEVTGKVTSLATYGAFVDVGGVDALLHISDMSWTRLDESGRILSLGDEVRVKVLKIDAAKGKISVGLKQMTTDPWAGIEERTHVGDRVHGTVRRTTDFGAFVELAPGVEGLIHVSEMSWTRRIRKADDAVKVGESVEAVVLGVNVADRRISLGLKQALGDPWADAETRFKPGTVVEGKVRNLQQFGAFLELAEGVDGMVHIGDMSPDRLQHPSQMVKVGDVVRAQVLEVDLPKRRLRLGMKQLLPSPLEEFIKAHTLGEVITGRVIKAYPGRVQLDEGIEAACPTATPEERKIEEGSLAAKLAAVWKPANAVAADPVPATPRIHLKSGEIRKFRISKLEADTAKIEVEVA